MQDSWVRLAVLDTNVLVSAGIERSGAPARLVVDWILERKIEAVTSPEIIAEYREVVRRPKFRRYGFPPLWLEFHIEESLQLPDPTAWPKRGPDPGDASFLALAHAAGAWLITGNMRHFPETFRGSVTVLSPADYLANLEEMR